MSKWSSFEKQQLLTENWRKYLNEEEIDEGFADRLKQTAKGAYKGGKEAWEKSRPKVMSDYPATEIATIVKTISDLGKKANIPVDTAKIVDEFEEMLKAQNFVIKEQKLELGADLKLDLGKAPRLKAFMFDLAKKDKNLLAPLIKALSNGSFDVGDKYKSIANQLDKLKSVEAPSGGATDSLEKTMADQKPTQDVKDKDDIDRETGLPISDKERDSTPSQPSAEKKKAPEPEQDRTPELPVDQRSTTVTAEFEPEIEIKNDELQAFIKELDLGEIDIGITQGGEEAKRKILDNLPYFYKILGDKLKEGRIQGSFKLPEIPSTITADIPGVEPEMRDLLSLAFNRIIYRFIKEMTTGNKQIPSEVEDELKQIAPPPKDEEAPELAASEEEETDETPETEEPKTFVTNRLKEAGVEEDKIEAFFDDLREMGVINEISRPNLKKTLKLKPKEFNALLGRHPEVAEAIKGMRPKQGGDEFLKALAKIVVEKAVPSEAEPAAVEPEAEENKSKKTKVKKAVKKKTRPSKEEIQAAVEDPTKLPETNLPPRVVDNTYRKYGKKGRGVMFEPVEGAAPGTNQQKLVIDPDVSHSDKEEAVDDYLRLYYKLKNISTSKQNSIYAKSYLVGLKDFIISLDKKKQINESVMLRWKTIAGIK